MSATTRNPFTPGTGIDIVFNLNSLTPTIRSSIIFEGDESMNRLVISQPTPAILPSFRFGEVHITTLVKDGHGTSSRLGVQCRIIEFIKGYRLSGKETTSAILIEFTPPVTETNIRAAFRLTPTSGFNIVGKFIWSGKSYISGTDFRIHDISITGMGLIIPKRIDKKRNPLQDMKYGSLIKIGVGLLREGEKPATFTTRISIVRVNPNHSDRSFFVGMKFHNLDPDMEHLLGRFIHEAQLHGIRRISGM